MAKTTAVSVTWPISGPAVDVVVRGSFNSWGDGVHLAREGDTFTGTIELGEEVSEDYQIKFFVTEASGHSYWTVNEDMVTVGEGELRNNVLTLDDINNAKEKTPNEEEEVNVRRPNREVEQTAEERKTQIAKRGNATMRTAFTRKCVTTYNNDKKEPKVLVDQANESLQWSELSAGDVLYAGNPKDELLPQDVPVIELPSSARYWKTYTHNAELSNIVQQRFREGPNVVQCSILTTINSGDHDNGDSSVLLEGAIGSGKTTALMIGAVDHCRLNTVTGNSTRVLILQPTHEAALFAASICKEMLVGDEQLNVACAIGGSDTDELVAYLIEARPEIVVGTAGRVREMIDQGLLNIDSLELVIFEGVEQYKSQTMKVDSMHEQMSDVASYTKARARTILSMAMVERECIANLANDFTNTEKPLHHIKYGRDPLAFTVHKIGVFSTWIPEVAAEALKDTLMLNRIVNLIQIVTRVRKRYVIYCNSAEDVDVVYTGLIAGKTFHSLAYCVTKLHSLLPQYDRSQAIKDFNNSSQFPYGILVTTAVACNGISFADNPFIIIAQPPIDTGSHDALTKLTLMLGSAGRFGHVGEVYMVVHTNIEEEIRALAEYKQWRQNQGLACKAFDDLDFSILDKKKEEAVVTDWQTAPEASTTVDTSSSPEVTRAAQSWSWKDMKKVKKHLTNQDDLAEDALELVNIMTYKPPKEVNHEMIAVQGDWNTGSGEQDVPSAEEW